MAHNLVDAICCGDVKLAWNILVRGTYGNIDSLPANRPGTALFCCCTRGYLTLAAQLLEHGADVECKDENLATPLHGAVDNGHLELVRLLLSHRADVNAQTRRGDTALHLAAYRGFPYISQCLVVAGADLTVKNTKFMTPDMEARGQGHVSVARYLQAALEVVHPGEDKRTKCRSDSLTYLDPPTFFSSPENNDQDMESLWQLDANQQTHVLQSGTLPTQPKVTQNALLWQPQPRRAEVEAVVTLNQVQNSPSPSRHQQANQGTGHRLACPVCAKKPLKEQHFNVLGDNKCRDRADFEQMLEMNVSPPVSAQYGRQPEQNDENCGDRLDNTHIYSFQNQPQQYRQSQHQPRQHESQQKQITHHHPCHDHHIQSHHQFNTHTTHIPTDVHGPQREPHHPQYVTPKAPLNQYYQPQIPMSFLPFTQHGQYQFQPNADSNPSTWTQTKDVMNLKPTVSTPNQTSPYDRNTNSQNAVTLRPEILQYNDLLLEAQPVAGFSVDKMFAPVKSTSPHSGSGSRPDDGTGSMVLNNLSHRESLVLSEDGEDTSFNSGGSSQDSSRFSTLSSLHSLSLKHHVPNKVLRSKSLTYQTELSGNFSEDDKRGVNTTNIRGQRSERRQKSLSHFVPSGPPLLTSGYGSLEVQHPSLFSLDSLHSGSMRCGTPSSLTDTKRCSPPKRLSRSASSSPSVTVEASSSKLPQIIQQTAEDTAPGLKQQGTYLRSGQTNLCGRVPNETHSGNLCRRCSIDEDVLKSKANNIDRTTIDCCRRFSVAGTNSVNSLGNIIDSSVSPSSISGNSISGSSSISDSSRSSSNSSRSSTSNSSGTSGEIRGVCRNPSYESAYGSSNNSLGSSVFDSCGYVPSFNSYSDSATDLSCDKESWQNSHLVTPVTIDKPSSGALDRDQTIPKSAPSVPRVATRCTSLPTYILNDTTVRGEKTFNQSTTLSRSSNNIDTNKSKTGRDTDRNNVEKISNVLSQLNDLSLTSTEQHHSLASPGSLLFDKHQSLPPLTFINIPTN